MRKFKSAKQAQRFLSAFGPLSQHFQPRRHRLNAEEYRAIVQGRFQQWNEIIGVELASYLQNIPNLSLTYNIFLLYNSSVSHIPTNKLTIPTQLNMDGAA
jgi:hypothetical protein